MRRKAAREEVRMRGGTETSQSKMGWNMRFLHARRASRGRRVRGSSGSEEEEEKLVNEKAFSA